MRPSHTSLPERFTGEPEDCHNFLLACKLYLAEFPELTDFQRISMVIQRLSGNAQEWAASIWLAGGTLTRDYQAFQQHFREVFDHPDPGHSSHQRLMRLCQEASSVADYSLSRQWLE